MPPRDYDSTMARIAGNIAAGFVQGMMPQELPWPTKREIAIHCVDLAEEIVDEIRRRSSVPLGEDVNRLT